MIKQNKDGEPIFIPPTKILQELKYLHKELPAFCYSWAWEARCVCAFEKGEFIEAIKELKQIGCQKRCEVYAKKPILIGKRLFNVRLISYGASSPKKMFFGPNHLAHAFDKLMFDYVYIFLETPQKTAKKLQLLIQKAENAQNNRQIASFKESYKSLLGKEYEEQNMEEEQSEEQD
ncbi:unnamed protein product [Paramecium octaurelia]|uniref:Uncharacterized protein n=1 Tax=Paramecium octaurelia TaxID=43137 RepID=A0A8S1Y610_PAROT|nr:unnamed protein product [Paramecium octaurelia]